MPLATSVFDDLPGSVCALISSICSSATQHHFKSDGSQMVHNTGRRKVLLKRTEEFPPSFQDIRQARLDDSLDHALVVMNLIKMCS